MILQFIIKGSGYFLVITSTALSQIFMKIVVEQFTCDLEFEIAYGCEATYRTVAVYISIVGFLFLLFLIAYSNFFITK